MKTCQHCAEPIQDAARICPHCRKKQRWPLWARVAIGLAIVAGIGLLPDALSVPPATGNRTHDRIAALTEEARRDWLSAIVTSSGEDDCAGAAKTFYQGIDPRSGRAFWNVACSSGRSYAIAIEPDSDGSTKVLNCGVMGSAGVKCFTAFGEQ